MSNHFPFFFLFEIEHFIQFPEAQNDASQISTDL